jgi:hypothetical protein
MKIEYTLTLADYKRALALHNRQKLFGRGNSFFMLRIVPAFALFVIAFWLVEAALGKDSLAQNQPVTWISVIFFAALPLLWEWSVRRHFKQLFPTSVTSRKVSFSADDELIVSAIPDRSEGRFQWSAVDHFAQDEKITLIYVGKKRFLFLPTPAFSPEQRAELNDLIARHGVKAFIC